ncbi:hypothetical protein [Miltoncostaea oceani]|uniref:hypothetical protein n=1 Tax=Miltoncostaea oceani TaxID=2843216 RepID=UPI001C3DD59E|nr:hypothetical protein [Miltoncostaea oceani]
MIFGVVDTWTARKLRELRSSSMTAASQASDLRTPLSEIWRCLGEAGIEDAGARGVYHGWWSAESSVPGDLAAALRSRSIGYELCVFAAPGESLGRRYSWRPASSRELVRHLDADGQLCLTREVFEQLSTAPEALQLIDDYLDSELAPFGPPDARGRASRTGRMENLVRHLNQAVAPRRAACR